MATPNEKLAASLSKLAALQKDGRRLSVGDHPQGNPNGLSGGFGQGQHRQ
jgi:hypothetical protein